MARRITSGAELQQTSGALNAVASPDGTQGSITNAMLASTLAARTGSASWFANSAQPGCGVGAVAVATAGTVLIYQNAGTDFQAYVNTTNVYSGGTPVNGQWYRLELQVVFNGSTQISSYDFRIDGVSVASGSPTAFAAAANLAVIRGGSSSGEGWSLTYAASTTYYFRAYTMYDGADAWLDDFSVNDSTGAAQTSWPGSGKVVLLKPATDSAVGSGWTLGTGTAIAGNSGATAIKNTPPLGVADLAAGSDTKQIRNASSNTADYDTGIDSYTTAGIASVDTINVVVPFIWTGAPSATGAKSGNLVLVSNPAGGTDSHGNYRASANAGTWPTGWKWTNGTPQYAPSVTLGTSPILRADITSGTATRIAMVCSMGMYVDYTPAVIRVPRSPGVDSGNAHLAKAWQAARRWSTGKHGILVPDTVFVH